MISLVPPNALTLKAAQGTNLSPVLLQRLKDNILAPSGLFHLDLASTNLGPKELTVLGDIIKMNGLNCEGSAPLLAMDFSNNVLCGVNCWGRGIFDYSGLTDFCNAMIALKFVSRQKRIDLSRNYLGVQGMNLVTSMLSNGPPSFCEVFLKSCELSYDAMEKFANVLGSSKCGLQILDLSENGLGPHSGRLLGEALASNPKLKQLVLASCDLGTDGCNPIIQGVANNPNLELLNLNDNGFGDSGADYIGRLLRVNSKIKQLIISENSIGFEGISAIAAGLAKNRSLLYLGLQWNDINNDGAGKIAEALQYNFTIGSIHILGNHIDIEGVQTIVMGSLRTDNNPIELDLGYCFRPPGKSKGKPEKKVIKELPTEQLEK
jgi:hypothetical protein